MSSVRAAKRSVHQTALRSADSAQGFRRRQAVVLKLQPRPFVYLERNDSPSSRGKGFNAASLPSSIPTGRLAKTELNPLVQGNSRRGDFTPESLGEVVEVAEWRSTITLQIDSGDSETPMPIVIVTTRPTGKIQTRPQMEDALYRTPCLRNSTPPMMGVNDRTRSTTDGHGRATQYGYMSESRDPTLNRGLMKVPQHSFGSRLGNSGKHVSFVEQNKFPEDIARLHKRYDAVLQLGALGGIVPTLRYGRRAGIECIAYQDEQIEARTLLEGGGETQGHGTVGRATTHAHQSTPGRRPRTKERKSRQDTRGNERHDVGGLQRPPGSRVTTSAGRTAGGLHEHTSGIP
ncbi:hypothetical protein BJV78DRAFT_1156582 [Lactifluus subvellereus]|nr:hypothetical protein BJV78DRAFT_1156582 [Lactifluus subvellereus]